MTDYQEFLQSKTMAYMAKGRDVADSEIHPMLFPFQRAVVKWAVAKGSAAVFLDTGLGKTYVQLEWARLMGQRTLIIAPLSVARQTVRMAVDLGIPVAYRRSQDEATGDHIVITNYEMVDEFDLSQFGAVVLDESSILKALAGKTRRKLIALCGKVPYRLACTATPAPNDVIELGNHAEFLGVCTQAEMLAMFFVNANKEHTYWIEGQSFRKKGSNKGGTEWRLKHHAEEPFYRWLSTWAITMTKPSDLGFDDNGFILPELTVIPHSVHVEYVPEDKLFFTELAGIADRAQVRRKTVDARLEELQRLIASADDGQWVIWCGLDAEQDAIERLLGDACVSIHGSLSADEKERRLNVWLDDGVKFLLSKPRVCGFGLNLQQAHHMVFFGMNDSWETWYQCIRREYRFGQASAVDVHVIISEMEQEILNNIKRKEAMAMRLRAGLIDSVRNYEKEQLGMTQAKEEYQEREESGKNWRALLGDSCKRLGELADDSIDLSVYSPPFADLYTYTNSERDLGNSRGAEQFFAHYGFIIREILRVTKPGRLTCVHTSDIPAMAQRDGYIGIKDFPGDVIRAYQANGWVFVGRAFVQKNPQALRNGTPVLTPKGWAAIDALSVGDDVIGSDGKQTKVVGVWPHEKRTMYRVTFSDGATVDCDAQHLWSVRPLGRKWRTSDDKQWLTMRTDELAVSIRTPSGAPRYEIPLVKPVDFGLQDALPVHPYVIGVLLGDGCVSQRSTVEFLAEPEIAETVNDQLVDDAYVLTREYGTKGGVSRHTIIHDEWHKNPVLSALRELGIQGKRAWEKEIPAMYLRASIDDRMELLRGLLDTDGTCKKNGQAYFSTTSKILAENIVELVRGLGGLAGIRTDVPGYEYKGEQRTGRLRFIVTVNMPVDCCPFRLTRKVARWHQKRQIGRWIVAIDLVDESECTCITVANPDGLFVAKDYVVTHNSQAIRTKSKALLFVQLRKDSTDSRPALVDQILLFSKPGENAVPVNPVGNKEMDNETWIEWAHGIWLGIQETDTLQFSVARDSNDEKHICPLQLGVIERCIKLYSNPGETVLTPFMGIGSEAYMAVKLGRKAIGCELKRSYYEIAVRNLKGAAAAQVDLFSWAQEQQAVPA